MVEKSCLETLQHHGFLWYSFCKVRKISLENSPAVSQCAVQVHTVNPGFVYEVHGRH
jgi:hypothetical protein